MSGKENITPDSAGKTYWRQNEEFADLFNAYLYGGKQIIIADELEEQDTDASGIIEIGETKESVKGARDVIKVAKRFHGVEYAVLAVENQEGIHYAMPIRVMGYDYYTYNKQYREKKAEYKSKKEKLKGNEFLSGIKKKDRFLPVITLVLYYGEEAWNGPKSLHDMLDIPREIKEYVSDYQLHIIEIRDNKLKLKNQNNIDLFQLLSIIYDVKRSDEERIDEIEKYGTQREIDESVIDTIMSTANVQLKRDKEGERKMSCSLLDRVKEAGWEEGREEGVLSSVKNLMETLHLSAEQAMDALKISGEEKQKYYSKLP